MFTFELGTNVVANLGVSAHAYDGRLEVGDWCIAYQVVIIRAAGIIAAVSGVWCAQSA